MDNEELEPHLWNDIQLDDIPGFLFNACEDIQLRIIAACEVIQFGILSLRLYKYLPKDFIMRCRVMVLFVIGGFFI